MFQTQVERCWKKPYGGIKSQNPEVAFSVKLKRDGTLEGMPVPEGTPATPYLRVYQESALRAIIECQPYNLPAANFDDWRNFIPVFTERQLPPNQLPDAPKVDLLKQRVEGDLKLGYSPISFEDFALDYKSMVRDGKKVAVDGFYRKTGNIDELYASQSDSFPTNSPPASHIIPLLIDDAPRDTRAYLLRCTEQSPRMGCWFRARGTVTMCSLTIFGNSVPKPCLTVEGGWLAADHVCEGTLTDQRAVGLSLGDCDLNALSDADIKRIEDVCGEPNGVDDDSNTTRCLFMARITPKPGYPGIKVVKAIRSNPVGAAADSSRTQGIADSRKHNVDTCTESVDLVNELIRSGTVTGRETVGEQRKAKIDACVADLDAKLKAAPSDADLRRESVVGAAPVAATGQQSPSSDARAAEKTMPINFIGDWCYSSQENKTTSYTLPSWTRDSRCTKILSIDQHGFFGEDRHCEPVNMRLTKDTAPSGTAYVATVTARCQPDGPVTAGKLQIFEFKRYKGNLTVTTK